MVSKDFERGYTLVMKLASGGGEINSSSTQKEAASRWLQELLGGNLRMNDFNRLQEAIPGARAVAQHQKDIVDPEWLSRGDSTGHHINKAIRHARRGNAPSAKDLVSGDHTKSKYDLFSKKKKSDPPNQRYWTSPKDDMYKRVIQHGDAGIPEVAPTYQAPQHILDLLAARKG